MPQWDGQVNQQNTRYLLDGLEQNFPTHFLAMSFETLGSHCTLAEASNRLPEEALQARLSEREWSGVRGDGRGEMELHEWQSPAIFRVTRQNFRD